VLLRKKCESYRGEEFLHGTLAEQGRRKWKGTHDAETTFINEKSDTNLFERHLF